MKKYHVAAGDGRGYYAVDYASYFFASELLKTVQVYDPQAYIVEEEYHFSNADRIRAMSDEELAEYLAELGSEANNGVIYSDRPEEWLEWLKQPAEVDND